MRIAGVVLAAGGSKRMGRPKQLLPVRGRSLLRHAAEVAVESTSRSIVVLSAEADRFCPELDGLPVEVVVNREWELGPGTSVRAAVEVIEAEPELDAIVFLLCDQPLVDVAHVSRLIAARQATGLPMVASGYAGTSGVPALFTRECFPALRSLEPTRGARQLLAQRPERVAVVTFPDGEIDLDTPEDYERWLARPPVSRE